MEDRPDIYVCITLKDGQKITRWFKTDAKANEFARWAAENLGPCEMGVDPNWGKDKVKIR